MIEVGQNLQRLGDDRVRFLALDMGNEAHAAGVMLVAGIVQALRGGVLGQARHSCLGGSRIAPTPLWRHQSATHPQRVVPKLSRGFPMATGKTFGKFRLYAPQSCARSPQSAILRQPAPLILWSLASAARNAASVSSATSVSTGSSSASGISMSASGISMGARTLSLGAYGLRI